MKTTVRTLAWLVVAGMAVLSLAGCGSGPVTVTVASTGTVPWLAYQDGSGAWRALSGTSFTVADAAGRYGLAWECTGPAGQAHVNIAQATTSESTSVTASCQAPLTPNTYTVTGTVSSISGGGYAEVSIGSHITEATSSNPNYSVSQVPSGVQPASASGFDAGGTPTNMSLDRSVTISGNQTQLFDLSLGKPFTTHIVHLSTPPSGESPYFVISYALAGGGVLTLSAGTTYTLNIYPVVPSALVQTGDTYVLQGAAAVSTSTATALQTIAVATQDPTDGVTLQLPAVLAAGAGIGVNGGTGTASWGSVSLGASGTTVYGASVTPASLGSPAWSVVATGAWLGTATTYAFPDFGSTAGWNAAWGFPTGQTALAAVATLHANIGFQQLASLIQTKDFSVLPDGTTAKFTGRTATGTY